MQLPAGDYYLSYAARAITLTDSTIARTQQIVVN